MIDPHESNVRPFVAERRNHWRLKVSFSTVVIGGNNRGRVLDISPNGLALQTDAELIDDKLPKIHFHFSQSQPRVEARGRIAWKSDSRKVVGIEFIGLTDEVRQQMQTWIASKTDASESSKTRMSLEEAENVTGAEATPEIATPVPAPPPEAVDPIDENRSQSSILTSVRSHLETKDAPITAKPAGDEKIAGAFSKPLRLVGLALVAALLLLVFFLPGHYWRKLGIGPKSGEMTRPPNLPLPSSVAPAVPSSGLKPPLAVPTFVLQVGAMVHEENANALAESLRQLNFPVFVFQGPTDRLHHVFVGPFTSVDATLTVKKDLERRGFRAFRTEWKATSQ